MRIVICGLAELPDHEAAGITHLVSILDPTHPTPDPLHAGEHDRLELRFDDIIAPRPGLEMPQPDHAKRIIEFGRAARAHEDPAFLVHCHAGVSRSTAAALLLLADAGLHNLPDRLLAIRGKAWPNLRLVDYGARALGRPNLLRDAAEIYRRQILARPELADYMRAAGRGEEVELGLAPAAA